MYVGTYSEIYFIKKIFKFIIHCLTQRCLLIIILILLSSFLIVMCIKIRDNIFLKWQIKLSLNVCYWVFFIHCTVDTLEVLKYIKTILTTASNSNGIQFVQFPFPYSDSTVVLTVPVHFRCQYFCEVALVSIYVSPLDLV